MNQLMFNYFSSVGYPILTFLFYVNKIVQFCSWWNLGILIKTLASWPFDLQGNPPKVVQ